MNSTNISPPAGTTGLLVAPWSADEYYGVAADWREASATVYTYGPAGWAPSGRQVSEYCHSSDLALRHEIESAIMASGGVLDEDEIDEIIESAVEV